MGTCCSNSGLGTPLSSLSVRVHNCVVNVNPVPRTKVQRERLQRDASISSRLSHVCLVFALPCMSLSRHVVLVVSRIVLSGLVLHRVVLCCTVLLLFMSSVVFWCLVLSCLVLFCLVLRVLYCSLIAVCSSSTLISTCRVCVLSCLYTDEQHSRLFLSCLGFCRDRWAR